MKRNILVLGTVLWAIAVYSQNVSIPDTAFFNALVSIGVDTNNDSLISYEEAEAITSLRVHGDWFYGNITDMTGIEAFINLNHLSCAKNQITHLDVSGFSTLRYLYVYENQLTELDVSNCPELVTLYCQNNQLTSLDLSTNSELITLDCSNNLFTSLDLSQNNALTARIFGDDFGYLLLMNMPTLESVCVWTWPFPPEGMKNLGYSGSPNINFNQDCLNYISSNELGNFSIFPNPASNSVTLEFGTPIQAELEICSLNGEIIHKQLIRSSSEQVDMTKYSKGIYIVKIRSKNWVSTTKLVKK